MKAVHLNDDISFNMNTEVAIHVDSLITAKATVCSYIYKNKDGGWSADTMDCEIDWLLNGESVRYNGFLKLYTQLYGQEKLDKLIKDVGTEAEQLVEGRVATSFKDILNDEIK